MKRRIVLNSVQLSWMVMLIVSSFLLACKKEDHMKESLKCPVVAKEGSDDDITGKWKLVNAQAVFYNPSMEDYSCDDIVYDFRESGMLLVYGTDNQTIGYGEGQYTFEFSTIKFYEGSEGDYTLKIGNASMVCSIKNNRLILDGSALDAPILYLIRVK